MIPYPKIQYSIVWIYYCFLSKTYTNNRGLLCRIKLSCTKRDLGSILFINHIKTYHGAFMTEKNPSLCCFRNLLDSISLVTHKNISPKTLISIKNILLLALHPFIGYSLTIYSFCFFCTWLWINSSGVIEPTIDPIYVYNIYIWN